MDNNKGMIGLALGSWLVALAGGTLAGTLLWVLGGWSFLQGSFVGLIVFLVFGVIISWVMTRPLPAPGEVKINAPEPAPAESQAKAVAPAAIKAAAPKAAEAAPKVKPSKSLPGEEELASRKGDWKYEKEAKVESATPGNDERPSYLSDKPKGEPDDLKKISGVGPKLEQTLNDLGVWHYAQVAQFTAKDIAWVDERLRFKGRIERDDWVGQAKELAKAKG